MKIRLYFTKIINFKLKAQGLETNKINKILSFVRILLLFVILTQIAKLNKI